MAETKFVACSRAHAARSGVTGVVIAATPATNMGDLTAAHQVARDFIAAIAKHRHWDRAGIDAVPA